MSIINQIAARIVGSRNERLLKQYQKVVEVIDSYEVEYQSLSDADLQAKTAEFKSRLADGQSLDDLLPEAFAVVREASVRKLNLRHYGVQLIGGMVLHEGKIAEMGTGEGKTLVATLPSYLNALTGKGVHIVTVNDYLAKRDADLLSEMFAFLGLSIGVIVSDLDQASRQQVYGCDIIYATNNELGFDYLRDNMAFENTNKVQQKLSFAIVDEVDSILIDEARTPLIISGPADDHSAVYQKINQFINQFSLQKESGIGKEIVVEVEGDYTLDEKTKQVYLTERGHTKAENLLKKSQLLDQDSSLYDAGNILLTQHLNSALRAHICFSKDVDYIITNDEIIIVDEFTGRTMPGRRWSEGLHQAVEAKEGVSIKKENQTLASITFQNYFRLYDKLAGMTGTAATEAHEFQDIYKLETVVIPPNKPSIRIDYADSVYLSAEEKYLAIIDDIKDCLKHKQPVLVGTASIESSELLSNLLDKEKVKHEVLNAKQHEREAQIVANAGCANAVTIATNMAGRGTDIVLGGKLSLDTDDSKKKEWQLKHNAVLTSGGLRIIGAERNESRRVDNQLRGRCARQGDPGSTRFYLSLEDNLMRIFASDRVKTMMSKLGMAKGEAIEHGMVNRAIENAQKKVEGHNFEARKQLLEYDDVANDQRKIIYQKRNDLMSSSDVSNHTAAMRTNVISDIFDAHINPAYPEKDWDVTGLMHTFKSEFDTELDIKAWLDEDINVDEVKELVISEFDNIIAQKEELVGSEQMRHFEKAVMLQTLDHFWKEHLAAMDYLRQSIGLRGYGQKNPVQEYKRDAFDMFKILLDTINIEIIKIISTVKINERSADELSKHQEQKVQYQHDNPQSPTPNITASKSIKHQQPFIRESKKIGRNEPCPCGSGKKFKQCHGKKQ